MTAVSRDEYVAGLRQLADTLEANPDLVLPYTGTESALSIFVDTKADAVAWARAIPGTKQKDISESDYYGFQLTGSIRGLSVLMYARREQVCQRVVTGTREVTYEVPDPDVEVPTVTVTETVEDVEWVCGSLLIDEAVSA